MTKRVCECCGQPLPDMRLGVRLTPLKARIFDIIKRSGRDGINGEDLFRLVFGERGVKRSCLKSHIWQINELLEDTGHRIDGDPAYRLVKVGYDAERDFGDSIDECYRAIRERVAAGGPGWEPT